VLFEFFHVSSDQHLSQLDEVAVLLIVHLDDTPWVAAASDFAALGVGYLVVGSHDGKWNFRHDFLVLCDGLFIV